MARYKGKRVMKKTKISFSYIILAFILISTVFISSRYNSKKGKTLDIKDIYSSIDIPKDVLLRSKEETPKVEFLSKEIPIPLNISVEIGVLLEKNNLTYSNFINMLYYEEEFQNILNKYPYLSFDKIMAILMGEQVNLRDTIYVGDSRTAGLILSGAIKEEDAIYGIGYGYNWLIGNGSFSNSKTSALNGAINALESKIKDNMSYDIVIWLGVNDYKYYSASTYFEAFKELANNKFKNHIFHIISVGPVDDSKATTVSNSGINKFNEELKSLIENSNIPNLNYIDMALNESSIKAYDNAGLHYSNSDYQNISSIIDSKLTSTYSREIEEILQVAYKCLCKYDAKIETTVDYNMSLTRHK